MLLVPEGAVPFLPCVGRIVVATTRELNDIGRRTYCKLPRKNRSRVNNEMPENTFALITNCGSLLRRASYCCECVVTAQGGASCVRKVSKASLCYVASCVCCRIFFGSHSAAR